MDGLSNHPPWGLGLDSKRLTVISVLVAACISIQLLPIRAQLPNIEFTLLITFATGMILGSLSGALFGAAVMFVNGFLSPTGFAGINLPFQLIGIAIVGAAGGFYARITKDHFSVGAFTELAILGACLTFVYDIVTNFGMAVYYTWGGGMTFPQAVVAAIIGGIVFSVIHVSWNAALFGTATVPIVNAMQRILGGR
jgi:hypothetical protein